MVVLSGGQGANERVSRSSLPWELASKDSDGPLPSLGHMGPCQVKEEVKVIH